MDFHCEKCGATKALAGERATPPRGWKRRGEAVYCPACWEGMFRLRAVTFPVAEPIGASWAEFDTACHAAWLESTALAQWACNQLSISDVVLMPDQGWGDVCRQPVDYLYRHVRQRGPEIPVYPRADAWRGSMQSAQAIMQAMTRKYSARRREMLQGETCVPRPRYPQPYPVHNAAWSAEWRNFTLEERDTRCPVVCFPLNGRRWELRLRGGHQLRRQLAAFAHLVSGEARQGELAIYRRRSVGTHGHTHSDRPNGNGATSYRTMCKLVAWLPAGEERKRSGTLRVRTGSNVLLVADLAGVERAWTFYRRDMVRTVRQHAHTLEMLAEDSRCESRRPRGERVGMLDRYETVCHRYRCRINAFVDQAAAWLVSYAERQHVAALDYCDDTRSYFRGQQFPWEQLRSGIERRCDDRGIAFRRLSRREWQGGDSDAAE